MNLNLLVARKQKGLSQDQLSELTGIQQADISKIEKGGWTPPPALQQKLADALDAEVGELFGQSKELTS